MSNLKKSKLLAISFLFLFAFFINKQIKAQCHINDWSALKALYESTDGDNWSDNTGWDIVKANTPPADCDLENLNGISLDDGGRVEYLQLYSNKLKGSIPPQIGNLKSLSVMKMFDNELSGNIPPEIGNLSKLVNLTLSNNQLSGNIPAELGSLMNLTELEFSKNQLNGNIPDELGSLMNLTELHLNNNQLNGSISADLDRLTNLKVLWLHNNNLNGNIPATFGKLINLTELKLYYNKLTGNIPFEIGSLSKLVNLDLSNNQLSSNIPAELGNLFNLTELDLSKNQLSENIPDELGNLMNLTELYLSYNQLNGNIPADLGKLTNLKILHISGNNLNGIIPNKIGNLVNLKVLWLGSNKLSGNIPATFGKLTNLIDLRLRYNKLTGNIPKEMGNLTSLTKLSLQSNQLSNNIPGELGNLVNLTELYLNKNQLSGSIPADLGKLTNLEVLHLPENNLIGSIPKEIGNLINLKVLWLNNNELSGKIPDTFSKLSNLTALRLNFNELSGSIPTEIGNLVNLQLLWLDINKLSGEIPASFGKLINLTEIRLNLNELTGSIPKEMSNFTNLQLLWLHNNKLSGNIPTELKKLNTLKLEYNYFSCQDFQNLPQLFQQTETFTYSPQYYTPPNYDTIKSNVFDSISQNQKLNLEVDFPFDTISLTYQWYRNDVALPEETLAMLSLNSIQPNTAGKYTLHIKDENCLSDFKAISDPIYVILKGFDLYGQPVEYDQIMVSFNSAEETEKYESEILRPNAGLPKKACNCKRELYLWQFPSTEKAVVALLAIDEKAKKIKRRSKALGGFNNNLSIGEASNTPIANNVISDLFNNNYPDSVSVFILDSGLDETNYNATPHLFIQAPVNACYGIEKASGYSYVDTLKTIITYYLDDVWHGTFGFRSITADLEEDSKLKLVPLKIFDKNGEGTLFDLACALYHAIDQDADIINISAGYQGEPSDILESAINLAREKGIFITAAAGNDTLNIDNMPQYPAYYAGQYYKFYTTDPLGFPLLDSVKLDNVISVASINAKDKLSQFSNYGKQSVTLATYGENIHSYGLGGTDVVASGTSMSTFFATKALALEIANNNKRGYKKIWQDFETNWLVENPLLLDLTQTSKHINFNTTAATTIKGCTDETNCNYYPYANIEDGSCFPVFINLSNVSYQISKIYQANDSIISNKVIESLNTVTYKAGNLISLENGFEVKLNTTFNIEIGCHKD